MWQSHVAVHNFLSNSSRMSVHVVDVIEIPPKYANPIDEKNTSTINFSTYEQTVFTIF